mgnify:CR=1 FL=1
MAKMEVVQAEKPQSQEQLWFRHGDQIIITL